jgi:hypothetical protein
LDDDQRISAAAPVTDRQDEIGDELQVEAVAQLKSLGLTEPQSRNLRIGIEEHSPPAVREVQPLQSARLQRTLAQAKEAVR